MSASSQNQSAPAAGLPAQASETSLLNACLEPVLKSLRWRGTPRQVAEATGFRDIADLSDFRNAMARLGFMTRMNRQKLHQTDTRLLPALFLCGDRALMVLEASENGRLKCFDCATGSDIEIDADHTAGLFCRFELIDGQRAIAPSVSWFKQLMMRFEGRFVLLLSITLVLNLLALVPIFFVQSVYDQVVPSRDLTTLQCFVGGVVIVLICDIGLRLIRGAVLSHLGARLDFLVGSSLLQKLLSLPLNHLERMTDGAKLQQMREGDVVRNTLAGSLALSLLEMPFMLVFIGALAFIGGWLALVPVALALGSALLGILMLRQIRASSQRAALQHADHQALLVEILSNMASIKAGGTEAIWRERFRERSAQGAMINLRETRIGSITESIAYTINIVAGGVTLATGALFALDGSLSVGALIASMTIVWRLLAPIQAVFVSLTRIDQIKRSGDRLTRFLQAPSEMQADGGQPNTTRGRRFAGHIVFDKVYLRYDAHHEPALAGVNLRIEAGEIVAITGGNGSGKSTILKLIAALHQPQMGAVMIDGVDTRQLRPQELRQWVTLLPQTSSLFEGTLRDNLLLANPGATTSELWAVLAKVGLVDEVKELPGGLDAHADEHLSTNFIRRIALARTLLVDAPIVLLDEPDLLPDANGEDLLLEQLDVLRGRATVLLATHHPEHVKVADRAIVLRTGTVVHDGTPQQLMTRLTGQAK